MNKILVILNPAARGERARVLKEKIESLSPDSEVRLTTSPGNARALTMAGIEEGFGTIVAAGGDGTVNEVANGLAGSEAIFGILPVGTMNVFATELGIPSNLERAWEVIADGNVRHVDLPTANGGFFVQLAGIGLDAEVVLRTTADSKRALGPVSYLLTLAQVVARKPPVIFMEPEDGPAREGSFVLIGNGRFYGGPFLLFKDARLDDHLMDVLVFKNQSHWDVIRYVQAIAFGKHPELHDVEYFQTRGMTLHSEEDVPVELDGELVGSLPSKFEFSQMRLPVLAPHVNGSR